MLGFITGVADGGIEPGVISSVGEFHGLAMAFSEAIDGTETVNI